MTTPALVLQGWLDARLDAAGSAWLRESVAAVAADPTDRALFRSVSLVSRKLGKAPLSLATTDLALAAQARPDWDPSAWTIDQAARVRLLLATPVDADAGGEVFMRRLDQLCATADLDELVAFYRGLPLYPDAARHRARAAEGIRSNIRPVFEAVAHRNPYPAEQLAEDAWNQMVLKAIFVGTTLWPIVGLDRRANATLARMLGDYAHERWAASRTIHAELWRCIGPFAEGQRLADLTRVLDTGTLPERAAAVLALRSGPGSAARELLQRHAALRDAVVTRGITWTTLSEFT